MSFTLTCSVCVAMLIHSDSTTAEPSASELAFRLFDAIDVIATNHVTPASRSELAAWAVKGIYAKHGKPLSAELSRRLAGWKNPTEEDIKQLLRAACIPLHSEKDPKGDLALAAGIEAIFLKLEPGARPEDRSRFIRPEDKAKFNTYAAKAGVGLKIRPDPATGMIQVVTPICQSPAHKTGLRAGDLITHIIVETDEDGSLLKRPVEYSTKGMSESQANELILGALGTKVKLRIVREK